MLALSTPIVAFAVIGGFLGASTARANSYPHLRVFEDVVSLIMNNYVEEADPDKVMDGALRGLADGLDPDCAFLKSDQVRALEKGTPPAAGTTGIELTRQYYLRVVAAQDGSPGARAGLLPGDYIRAIDGTPTRDISVFEGRRLLEGQPGTKVSLTIIRGNAAEPHTLDVVREKPAAAALSGRMLASQVGYIRVPAFDSNVAAELRAKVAELSKAGATSFVIDVRRSATGALENGFAAARLFVRSGTLAVKEVRNQQPVPVAAGADDGGVTAPVAVLVNAGTAGAAELFAAALHGNKRADTIGERTVGRTALQKLVKLSDGSGLWLSWARYQGPASMELHGRGIEPTVPVEEPETEFGDPAPTTDPVLDKALEQLAAKKAA
jgi:carboxyl-terminal processing protease